MRNRSTCRTYDIHEKKSACVESITSFKINVEWFTLFLIKYTFAYRSPPKIGLRAVLGCSNVLREILSYEEILTNKFKIILKSFGRVSSSNHFIKRIYNTAHCVFILKFFELGEIYEEKFLRRIRSLLERSIILPLIGYGTPQYILLQFSDYPACLTTTRHLTTTLEMHGSP